MSGQTWSITISGNPPATFTPDVYSESPNPPTALQAQNGDVISWNNTTSDEHQLVETDQGGTTTGTQITNVIEPGTSSTPGFVPDVDNPPATIYYKCTMHANELGSIDIVA